MKSARSAKSRRLCGGTVPQLGEQKNQSCAPLKVNDFDNQETIDQVRAVAKNLGMTVEQYLGAEDIPMAELAYKYKYGEPLVKPELVRHLSTQMRRLHEWYMKACQEGQEYLSVGISEEHYFRGNDLIYLQFNEFFQLFNQDALDKSFISCYCL
jgi:hypothetical protein